MSSPYIKNNVNIVPPDRRMSREDFLKWYYTSRESVSEDKYKNSLKKRLR
jgi:hypothetical protein